ncbi:MAG: hypothetical protein JRI89_14925 [Deltaproteobacteria bacterium]|nr:hypothetical protein [Deltaproteobacteria bacterium]
MSELMECMCQECGISHYLPEDTITLEDPANSEVRLLSGIFVCSECGGALALIGKAGDEPSYRLEEFTPVAAHSVAATFRLRLRP